MTTRVWKGQAPAVAQVDKIGVTAYDAATQYQLTVNGEVIVSASGGGSANAVAAALASGWNAVTGNPYSVPITALATGSDVQLTADVAGNPFTVAGVATGGTGTIGSATGQVSNAGPNDWATAANWSGGAVPVNADDVVFRDSGVPVLWGLAQSGVTLASLVIEQSFTGTIGLNSRAVVTGAAGASSSGKAEYREDYLDIGWDDCRIGEQVGPGAPAGSGRLKLDNAKATGGSTTTVFDTGNSSDDANLPAVRLVLGDAGANLFVRRAPGGLGLAVDDPAEVSTAGAISVADETGASQVFIGEGVTFDTFEQQGGENYLRSAAAVTGVTVLGGELTIEGDQAITALTVEGGTVYPNNVPSAGNAVTTVNIDGGTVDGTRSREARTWGTVNLKGPGSTLRADDDVVTITTLNEPDGPYTVSVG